MRVRNLLNLFKKANRLLFLIATLCAGFILVALYLQIVKLELPCTLCVLQRYMFIVIGGVSLFGAFSKKIRLCSILGSIASLVGIYLSAYQLWVIAHPSIQCGKDALEDIVNSLWPAKIIPILFQAESFCSDVPEAFLFFNPPQWALIWFVIFTVFLFKLAYQGT